MNNEKSNNYDDVFICNANECYNINEYCFSHFNDNQYNDNKYNDNKYNAKKDTKCSLCSYDFDNLEKLRNQINQEMKTNKQSRKNLIKIKLIEGIIAIGVGILIFCAIVCFIIQAYTIHK